MSRRRSRAVAPLLARAHEDAETETFGKVREQLLTIADTWPVLAVLLAAGSTPGSGGGKPASRAPIDAHVADVRQELALWVRFLARVLMEEVTVERTVMPPWADAGVHAAPWAPPSQDTGELAHHIATERLGHFLHHEDEHLRIEFMDDAERLAGLARRTAWPSGARWMRTGIDCTEHGTSELGQRVACQGEYRVFMHPGASAVGDMVCSEDGAHAITPLEWQRAQRRRPLNAQAAARFAQTLRLARVG
jgi:hypothetical protein